MATAPSPVLLCGRCGETAAAGELVTLASHGVLASVCQRCFLLEQIGSLAGSLPRGDETRDLVEEGLRTLYDIVLARAQEVAEQSSRHASSRR